MTQCTVGVIGYILERFTLYWRSEQKKYVFVSVCPSPKHLLECM